MGLLDKFRQGLAKTRQAVSQGFRRIAANLGHFDEEQLDDLEMLFVQSDMGMETAQSLIEEVKTEIRSSGDNSSPAVLASLRQTMYAMLGENRRFVLEAQKLNVLLMVGVNGTGKTTTAGKLAWHWQQQGHQVLVAAADTFRAAAIEQLKVWTDKAGVSLIANHEGADPASVVYNAVHAAQARQADILIVDTAGRLHNKQNLMDELAKIRRVILREVPEAVLNTLLVIDATTGQNALLQARAFDEATHLDGLILTKLDGNAKGGIALAVARQSRLPIYFAGLGEGVEDLLPFDREAYIASLLPAEAESEGE